MRQLLSCLLVLVFCAAGSAWAGSHEQSAPKTDTGRSATVAGGQSVALAKSAKSGDEWGQQRPSYRDLIPGQR